MKVLKRVLAITCAISIIVPQAFAGVDSAGFNKNESNDDLLALTCQSQSQVSSDSNLASKATGLFLGTTGGLYSIYVRKSSLQALAENTRLMTLLDNFIKAKKVVSEASLRLKQINSQQVEFLARHRLTDRIMQLTAESDAINSATQDITERVPRVSHERLFEGRKDISSKEMGEYSNRNIQRAQLEAELGIRTNGNGPLNNQVRKAFVMIQDDAKIRIHGVEGKANKLATAIEKRETFSKRGADLRTRFADGRFARGAKYGVAGFMIVAGVALYFEDEIGEMFATQDDDQMTPQQKRMMANHLSCLSKAIQKTEAPVQIVPANTVQAIEIQHAEESRKVTGPQ